MKSGAKLVGLWALWSALAIAQSQPTYSLENPQVEEGSMRSFLSTLGDAVRARSRTQVITLLGMLRPTSTPTSVEQASSVAQTIATTAPNIVEYGAQLIVSGVVSGSVASLFESARGAGSPQNSNENSNPDPPRPVYPKIDGCDAPYSVSESRLRSAIFIPETFTYGEKPPVILFPGTGSTGWLTFKGNFIPLLSETNWADPIWVNVPDLLLEDAQVNAEYAAYAINYIASMTNRNVSVIAWSQGNIDTQWAFKYWPSTRQATSDHIAISADYKGTILGNVISISGITNDASVVQQEAGSNFIKTLRSNGGDSSYVPTTSIYSGFFDEIVQPQSGNSASAVLLDARGVGVSNSEAQVVCRGQPGGGFYTHEGLLASSLAFALAKDALTNDGPGEVKRLNLNQVCGSYLAPGLGLQDFLATANAAVTGILAVILHLPKVVAEPPIREYAKSLSTCS